MTNKEYKNSKEFTEKCEVLGITATVRQASKFRNAKDAVYKGISMKKD